jgi:dolichyl-phosphate-mannose-protein mannosyltransferase
MIDKVIRFIHEWKERAILRQVCLALILWGVTAWLLFHNLGYPRAIVFDETYMIPRAQRYLKGMFFQESHPPLGRLAIFLGQHLVHPNLQYDEFALAEKIERDWPTDEDMTGYRVIPALFGTIIPVLVFFILRSVLSGDFLAFVLSMAVVFDNALLTQARFALSDSMLVAFCLLSILIFVYLYSDERKTTRSLWLIWVLWGGSMATAALVKFTGGFVGLLVVVYMVKLLSAGQRRGVVVFGFAFSLAFIATTVAAWQIHFSLLPNLDPSNDYEISAAHRQMFEGKYRPDPFTRFIIQFRDAMVFIKNYHEGVPRLDLTNPDEIGSPWYHWPFGGRVIPYRWETPDGKTYQYIYLIGNPVTWLLSLTGVILGTAVTISDILFRYLPEHHRRWIYIFTLLYCAYMLPMIFVQRVMYLYHYLPPLLIGVLMFGIILNNMETIGWNTRRNILLVSLVGVMITFWVYKPFTFYEPLNNEQFQQRNIWPAWDLRCASC